MVSRGNGLSSAALVIDESQEERARLRERARERLGITGREEALSSLRETLTAPGVQWYPLIALGLLVIVDEFSQYAFFVLGPEISASLGISKTLLALAVVLKQLAVTLATLPMAGLSQRRPRRGLLSIVTAFGWSVMTGALAFIVNIWGLVTILLMDGAASGSVRAVHPPLLMDSYPPHARVRAFAAYRGFDQVGNILAPLLVALFAVVGFTWRGTFLLLGALCLAAAVASLGLRDPGFGRWDTEPARRSVRSERDEQQDTTAPSEREVSLGFFEIFHRLLLIPTVRRVLATWAVWGMFLVPLQTFLFFFLDERWNMGPGARGLFFALMPLFSIAALAFFGRHGEALFQQDPRRFVDLATGIMLTLVATVTAGVFTGLFGLMVLLFGIAFACVSLLLPSLNILLLSGIAPKMRVHAAALAGIAWAAVGGMGGLLLLGGIDRRFGVAVAVASLAVPGTIAVFVLRSARSTVTEDVDRLVDELVEEEAVKELRASGASLPMLACRNIDFSYGRHQILFDVDFSVDEGEMVALLGTNGAGKSTLLRVLSGIGLPSRGSIYFRGAEITYLDAERRVRLGITQVPGGRAVFEPLSVVENLRVFGYSHGQDRGAVERGIEDALEAFPSLEQRRNQPASTLSGGEQQMLALSKAFILRPQLLLIDELSLGLAPVVVEELLSVLRQINQQGTGVVLVEQSVNIALSLVEHAYFMEKGQIKFDGPAAELMAREDLLRSVFLEGAAKALDGGGAGE